MGESTGEPDQSHGWFLIAPAKYQGLVLAHYIWLELRKQFWENHNSGTTNEQVLQSLLLATAFC